METSEIKALQYDGKVNIAIGRSRREKHWRNHEMLWSELVNRLSQTHRTTETYKEYMAANKSRQDEIKDVGGFVGGHISGGRRKADNITNRQIITLDIDYGDRNVFEDFNLLYGNAGVLYTTHKHGSGQFRGRLVAPLNRPVFRDEYQAIARKLAGDLGIENFDDTTFEPSRLMYWPSTARDGEYLFLFHDGPFLSTDDALNSYTDWRDSGAWPVSERVNKAILRESKKQGDPLEKPGLIGAYCRCFTIQEAIETHLPDVYEPCGEGRYTYREGSTAAGLVIYEDKFAYSHHGTDPATGKLCNAFDLVRIHKFGLKDEDAKENTAGNRLPSFTAMTEFVGKLPEVRAQLVTERVQKAGEDFSNLSEEETDDTWKEDLDVDTKGRIRSTIDNIVIILENDPQLKGRLALNEFSHREVMLDALPWRPYEEENDGLVDKDDAAFRHFFEKKYGVAGVQKLRDGLDIVVHKNRFHPVRDYLSGLKWDGVSRLDTFLMDYLGAKDSPYTRAVGRKTFTAAVARIFRPGIKFDNVLTLCGPQGLGKSTAAHKMGRKWYTDSFATVTGKEACEQIQGVWIVEMGELAGLKKAEVEQVKHFITKQSDRFRVAYGRRAEEFTRQCIFIGTTNNKDFLKDPSGNRRFWPVDVGIQPISKSVYQDLDGEVDQLWAEAIVLFRNGESLYLDKNIEMEAFQEQKGHSETDDRAGMVQEFLDMPIPSDWDTWSLEKRRQFIHQKDIYFPDLQVEMKPRDKVCVAEIWCELFYGLQKEMNSFNTKNFHNILRQMDGWKLVDNVNSKLRFPIYGIQKAYKRCGSS